MSFFRGGKAQLNEMRLTYGTVMHCKG